MKNTDWITCEKKLPVHAQLCFITVEGETTTFVIEAFFDAFDIKFTNVRAVWDDYDLYQVLAWMPCEYPDPYKKEEN